MSEKQEKSSLIEFENGKFANKKENPFIDLGNGELANKIIALDHSLVLKEANVNKSAVVKTDIKYLWNQFCQNSGGVENAIRFATKAMQDPSAFADVSSINQHDPLQSMVSNEVRKRELKKDIDRRITEQQSKQQPKQPVAPTEPSSSNEK